MSYFEKIDKFSQYWNISNIDITNKNTKWQFLFILHKPIDSWQSKAIQYIAKKWNVYYDMVCENNLVATTNNQSDTQRKRECSLWKRKRMKKTKLIS